MEQMDASGKFQDYVVQISAKSVIFAFFGPHNLGNELI
jgi:hypothetical protein